MKRNIYYVMSCSQLTGDSTVKFFIDQQSMIKYYDSLVNPFFKCIDVNNLQELEGIAFFYNHPQLGSLEKWGGFRVNTGEQDYLDELLGESNIYHQWGIEELEITTQQPCYLAIFSEYVDESQINFYNHNIASFKYNEAVTDHISMANEQYGCEIGRHDNTTWNLENGEILFSEDFTDYHNTTSAYFNYDNISETVRMGNIAISEAPIIHDINHNISDFVNGLKELKVYIASNPDDYSIGLLLQDPLIGIYFNYDVAVQAVKDSLTEEAWNELGREPEEYVSTHIVE